MSEADRLAALLDNQKQAKSSPKTQDGVQSAEANGLSVDSTHQGAERMNKADQSGKYNKSGKLSELHRSGFDSSWQSELRHEDGRIGVMLASGKAVYEQRLSATELQSFTDSITVFKDDTLWIVNKPAGLLSVPGRVLKDSLLNRLEAVDERVKLIHRLDMDTSGIMVFALSAEAQTHVSKQFIDRSVDKRYESLVEGVYTGELGAQSLIDVPVRYDPPNKPRHVADPDFKKAAITNVWLMGHESLSVSGGSITVSRLTLEPVTGRSHQLRVHALYAGHAMIGDPIYATAHARAALDMLALFSKSLELEHPLTQERVSFLATVPF